MASCHCILTIFETSRLSWNRCLLCLIPKNYARSRGAKGFFPVSQERENQGIEREKSLVGREEMIPQETESMAAPGILLFANGGSSPNITFFVHRQRLCLHGSRPMKGLWVSFPIQSPYWSPCGSCSPSLSNCLPLSGRFSLLRVQSKESRIQGVSTLSKLSWESLHRDIRGGASPKTKRAAGQAKTPEKMLVLFCNSPWTERNLWAKLEHWSFMKLWASPYLFEGV